MTINQLIRDHGTSIAQIAKMTHISVSTLSANAKKSPQKWTVRVMNCFAKGLGMTPAELLSEVNNQKEIYNDLEQTIMGIYVKDRLRYLELKQIIIACAKDSVYLNQREIRSLILSK